MQKDVQKQIYDLESLKLNIHLINFNLDMVRKIFYYQKNLERFLNVIYNQYRYIAKILRHS